MLGDTGAVLPVRVESNRKTVLGYVIWREVMGSTAIADVDRRVEIVDGSDEQKRTIARVSQLRGLPHVVLLGEPGSGKTTVLQQEARRRDVEAVKVRALIHGIPVRSETLFLDALDEYRSDGARADKAHGLARAIVSAGAEAWWLSCRAEDWRKESDIDAIRSTANGRPIIVAQLQPLSRGEAAVILRALGESDPEAFLDRAASLGADAFTQSPLSLRLLRAAIEGERQWPKTRYDLFESAVRRLAYEDNSDRRHDPRPAPSRIIEATGTANLVLLISGARSLWRSSAMPPDVSDDRRAYLTAQDLGIDHDLMRHVLDTALFRGEGESFEPMHRTIAEFTAARALARAVRGEAGRAALPLSRAMALILAPDGGPPTELRGLFAWFAAHLAKMGDHDGTFRLIEVDAPTVMSYGDAAVFDTQCRRMLLRNLTKVTPYFRSLESSNTSTAGLAGEDLADDFSEILRAPSDGTQRLYTVLDALTTGVPVHSLKPLLREMALDALRPEWVRRRAAHAWLNGHVHPAQGRRELFDALDAEPVSISREDLRLELVREEFAPELTTPDIQSLISGVRNVGRTRTLGRTMWLKDELRKRSRPDLFEISIKSWLREHSGSDYQPEIDGLLDVALASAIRDTEGLTAERLWQWIMNASWYRFPRLKDESRSALCEWLAVSPEREIALLLSIRDRLSSTDGPRLIVPMFLGATARLPDSEVVRRLLSIADCDFDDAGLMLELAFHCVNTVRADVGLYWQVYERLSRIPALAANFDSLRVHIIEPWRLDDMKREANWRKKKVRRKCKEIAEIMPLIPEIAIGRRPRILEWGQEIYFGRDSNDQNSTLPGVLAVAAAFNADIADAIVAGWRHILSPDFAWPSSADLGRINAQHNHYYVERAALAAVDLYLQKGMHEFLNEVPLVVAISVLSHGHLVRSEEHNERLEAWAYARLCRDPDAAAEALLAFWVASLEAGATGIAFLWTLGKSEVALPVLQRALPVLLREHPAMPAYALGETLRASARCMQAPVLAGLARDALARPDVIGKARRLWGYVDFSLDPKRFDAPDAVPPSQRTIIATFDLVSRTNDLLDALDSEDENRPIRRAMMVFALGRFSAPSADYPAARHMRGSNREAVVRRSIDMLGAIADASAGSLLTRLIENEDLAAWRKELMHAKFMHARLERDRSFEHPCPGEVLDTIAGRAPANAADLRAVVAEELRRLQRELRTSADSPWREYWDDVGKRGRMPSPKVENACRDHLILRLRDRLQPYEVAMVLPEARHAEETRSDIALASFSGRTFPIEIKRDSNEHLWTAAATQLQQYASADTADGSGLYLVFWFNHPDARIPARPDGGNRPETAEALEAMLIEDLPDDLRRKVDVIVFDVSDRERKLVPKASKRSSSRGKEKPAS